LTERNEIIVRVHARGDEADPGAIARQIYAGLVGSGLAQHVAPLRTAGRPPPGAKAGELIDATAILLTVLPSAVEGLFGFLRDHFSRPGAPPVQLSLARADETVAVTFDPARISREEIVQLAGELRSLIVGDGAALPEPPRPA
jgi:hypothetical protein